MRTLECPCGGVKEPKAKRCRACFEAARTESRRMQSKRVPRHCDCRHRNFPSAWHCACGRWKPSSASVCEVCEQLQAVAA